MINVECTSLTIFETSLEGFSGLQILVMLNWVNDKVIHDVSCQFKHVMLILQFVRICKICKNNKII
jgi:hypothetical protein